MKKFKALLKSRRGVAIEFAIGVMFITVAVSTILLSTAIHEINAQKRDNDSFSEKLAVEQFAEEVLAGAKLEAVLIQKGMIDGKIQSVEDRDLLSHRFYPNSGTDAFEIQILYQEELKLVICFVFDNNNNLKITSWTWQ